MMVAGERRARGTAQWPNISRSPSTCCLTAPLSQARCPARRHLEPGLGPAPALRSPPNIAFAFIVSSLPPPGERRGSATPRRRSSQVRPTLPRSLRPGIRAPSIGAQRRPTRAADRPPERLARPAAISRRITDRWSCQHSRHVGDTVASRSTPTHPRASAPQHPPCRVLGPSRVRPCIACRTFSACARLDGTARRTRRRQCTAAQSVCSAPRPV